ncbi:MAG: TatD family hydrolase [Stagnimonas sp.]|nr:TatD family hydrolase [Stagnimonas sp.]
MSLIDIGANLAHESFAPDYPAVLERAWAADVSHIVLTGSCRTSNQTVAALAAADPVRLSCTAGVHPHHAADWTDADAALIRTLAALPQLVSLGECGLDYHRDLSPRDVQRRVFIAQLELAIELRKPVFLHQRGAHEDFLAILNDYRAALVDACVHCFTDTLEAMQSYAALDCYIGITGWVCDAKRGATLRAVAPHIPAARLLIETDAPYLLPHNVPRGQRPSSIHSDKAGIDGRRNEPGYLPWVAAALAELRGVTVQHIATQTTENAQRFFRLAPH